MEHFFLEKLAVWKHEPEHQSASARVLLIHGISEHSGRHINTVQSLLSQGIEVICFDLQGAGKSGGKRQWINQFQDYIDDTVMVFNWIMRSLNPLPVFVLGHSLGGTIALSFAAIYGDELAGLILSAPAFKLGQGVSPFKVAVGRMLNPLIPTLRVPGNLAQYISRDKKVVDDYMHDPLTCHTHTLRQGHEVVEAFENALEPCERVRCPVLIVHGSADRIIKLEGSYEILQNLASRDRTLFVLPNSFHELHNDLDKEVYFQFLNQWICQRVSNQGNS